MTLREMREARGLSRTKVANALHCSNNMVYRWERGEQVPGLAYGYKLAQLYGVSLETIASSVGATV